MCPLLSSQKQFLLEIARRSMVEAVHKRTSADTFSLGGEGLVCTGAFASLHRERRLRGCIGQIGAPQPSAPLVAYCARAAALEDPRFRPVELGELAEIDIELSILSVVEAISPDQIEIGKHGLMITSGARRGVLLPQVAAQYGWSAARFLEETCSKAGLDRAAWRGGSARIEAFTAEVFSESQLCAEAAAALEPPAESGYSSST
jgi:AmmeMemoRadiSam system protein A